MAEADHQRQITQIVRANGWLMGVLAEVRACGLPDWLVGAGVLRNLVWDHLHGYTTPTPIKDVDVVFFDPVESSEARDRAVERHLRARRPEVPWEVTNQAGVHRWYHLAFGGEPVPRLTSVEDAVATWPETATCVGVRLLADDGLAIVAPYGLADLVGLVLRRNPRRVTVEEYRRRIVTKQIAARWPRVEIIDG
jgi:hypothetical protein